MGVYYYFHNITRDECNEASIPPFNLSFIAKLNSYPEDVVLNIFSSLIEVNGWDKMDHIRAAPDYHDYSVIEYNKGVIEYIEPEQFEYDD